ncbi:hypothetical protein [Morganella phage Mecenats66]|nr:hypothetical protein [Morganella phage Mecenats66]
MSKYTVFFLAFSADFQSDASGYIKTATVNKFLSTRFPETGTFPDEWALTDQGQASAKRYGDMTTNGIKEGMLIDYFYQVLPDAASSITDTILRMSSVMAPAIYNMHTAMTERSPDMLSVVNIIFDNKVKVPALERADLPTMRDLVQGIVTNTGYMNLSVRDSEKLLAEKGVRVFTSRGGESCVGIHLLNETIGNILTYHNMDAKIYKSRAEACGIADKMDAPVRIGDKMTRCLVIRTNFITG